jgi:hypothetical protein
MPKLLVLLIAIFVWNKNVDAKNYPHSHFRSEGSQYEITPLEIKMGIEVFSTYGPGVVIKHLDKNNTFHCTDPEGRLFIKMHGGWDEAAKTPHIIGKKGFFRTLLACKLRNLNSVFLADSFSPGQYFRMGISKYSVEEIRQEVDLLEKNEREALAAEKQKAEKKAEIQLASNKRTVAEESKDIYASNVDFNNPGIYYAIIIGSSDYADPNIPDLDSLPIFDALQLKKTLLEKYTFEKQNIRELYNPTRRDIVTAFAEMSKKITPNDNLLIFYGGHGHYEKENDIGYWLPADAEVNNPSNWLYNDQLVADVKKIKSLHTLLISDACFSGSIFKSRSVSMEEAGSFIKQKYQLPSRKAITSGTLKTVPNKSVFLMYLIDRLTNNKEAFFSASQLFQSIEEPVSNNSRSLPQFGVIQNVGDQGGDFIFIRR